ncbi:PQQ-binding-like beta-propeller repeat protein [Candidatus Solincola tengchongensis]|uniref:outer membrane protein assembly factor BamB family protein n=1 Tax=Candidatus Solincola tengchongensis TaxID=2900693 RepID=UPI00258071CF|nr:PQQ-binding-like beta-propeller repeat protein [Candidatus Solincola tengchongensis]
MEQRWVAWFKLFLVAFFLAFAGSFVALTVRGAKQAGAVSSWPDSEPQASPFPAPRASIPELLRRLDRLEVLRLRPSWEVEVGSGQALLSLEGDRLYVASSTDSSGSSLYCLDARSGAVLWSRTLDAWISSPPSPWKEVVYVGTTSHVLHAVDAQSGNELWSFTAQGEILTRPLADDGLLLFFADNNAVFGLSNRLYALDPGSGALLWSYDTESWTPSPPATGQGLIFTAGSKSTVLALDRNTGREVWVKPVDSAVFSSPLLAGDRLYVATVDGRMYALDIRTGERLWEVGMYHFTPSFSRTAKGNVLLDRCPDRVLALSMEDGRIRWGLGGNPLLAAGPQSPEVVYVYFPEGRLLELDADTGRCLRIYVFGFDFSQRPYVSGGWVYCVSSDGKIRACLLPQASTAD